MRWSRLTGITGYSDSGHRPKMPVNFGRGKGGDVPKKDDAGKPPRNTGIEVRRNMQKKEKNDASKKNRFANYGGTFKA